MAEKRAFAERYLETVIILPIEPQWNQKARKMMRPKAFNPDLIEPARRAAA